MRTILLTLLLLLLNSLTVNSQSSEYGSTIKSYEISSDEGKAYTLNIKLPTNYDENKTYQVLYYLDAWWLSDLVLGTYTILRVTEKVDDVVLVGINLEGDVLDWNIQRTLDFTPSVYDMPIDQKVGIGKNAIPLDSSTTGGADVFIQFLETKVIDFVGLTVPNIEENRGFIGHSFGGLFGFYAMQNKPELFTDYILISPSLWWNNQEMLHAGLFEDYTMKTGSGKVYLSYGEGESRWIARSNTRMDEIMKNLKKYAFDYQFTAYEKADHNSVLPRALYDGLLYLYAK